ncbi:MAG: hypothetical protein FWH19_00360 [Treponema sp.]|nr:hypothetical protein [Treponema sp.]
MKKYVLFAVTAMLAIGLVFVGCSSDDDDPTIINGSNQEFRDFTGIDDQGKSVVVRISRSVARSLVPTSGDSYAITYDGQEISRGTISVDGIRIIFQPNSGTPFEGTLIDWYLSIPVIPHAGGVVRGFAMQATSGAGPGESFIRYTVEADDIGGVGDGDNALVFTFTIPAGRDFVEDLPLNAIRITNASGEVVIDMDATPTLEDTSTATVNEWTLALDADSSKTGLIFVQIIQRDIEPTLKPVVIGDDTDFGLAVGVERNDDPGVENQDTIEWIEFDFTTDLANNLTLNNLVILSGTTAYPGAIDIRPSTPAKPNPYLSPDAPSSDPRSLWRLDVTPVAQGKIGFFFNVPGYAGGDAGGSDRAPIEVIVSRSLPYLSLKWVTSATAGDLGGGTAGGVPTVVTDIGHMELTLEKPAGGGTDTSISGKFAVNISGVAGVARTGEFGTAHPYTLPTPTADPLTMAPGDDIELTTLQYIGGQRVNIDIVDGIGWIQLTLHAAVAQTLKFSILALGVEGTIDVAALAPDVATNIHEAVLTRAVTDAVRVGPASTDLTINLFPVPAIRIYDRFGNEIITGSPTFSGQVANPATLASGGNYTFTAQGITFGSGGWVYSAPIGWAYGTLAGSVFTPGTAALAMNGGSGAALSSIQLQFRVGNGDNSLIYSTTAPVSPAMSTVANPWPIAGQAALSSN